MNVFKRLFKIKKFILFTIIFIIIINYGIKLIQDNFISEVTVASNFNNKHHIIARFQNSGATVQNSINIYYLKSGNESAGEELLVKAIGSYSSDTSAKLRIIKEDILFTSLLHNSIISDESFMLNLLNNDNTCFKFWENYKPRLLDKLTDDSSDDYKFEIFTTDNEKVVNLQISKIDESDTSNVYFLHVDSLFCRFDDGNINANIYWSDGSLTNSIKFYPSILF